MSGNRTPMTRRRLESIGFGTNLPNSHFSIIIDEEECCIGNIETILKTEVYLICFDNYSQVYAHIKCLDEMITIPRKFRYIEEIKELLTGLTGKTDFHK